MQRERGMKARPTKIMFAVVLANFLLAAADLYADLASTIYLIQGALMSGSVDIQVFQAADIKAAPIAIVSHWSLFLPVGLFLFELISMLDLCSSSLSMMVL